MADDVKKHPFFVGYGSKVPPAIAAVVYPAFLLFVLIMVLLSLLLSSRSEDPGDGRFRFDLGRQEISGILQFHPYPVLRLPAADGEPARTLMMSGQGKRGAFGRADGLENEPVTARGIFLKRGDLTMLQLAGRRGLEKVEDGQGAAFRPSEPEALGKWRLAGEICDGKCYAGAMRPGTGLAHKACANLCIEGGIPAVFVSVTPIEGHQYFLLADENGNPAGALLSDYVALYVEAEGEIERLDDLAVLRIDPTSIRVLP